MTRSFSFVRLLSVCAFLLPWGCASTPELDLLLAESPRGAVYLERIPDRSFQAAHPIKIDQDTLARVLRGISVKEHQGMLQDFLAGQPPVVSAFTEDEIRYLAPLLAEGLTHAASDQQVGFRLIQTDSPDASQPAVRDPGASDPSVRLALMETSRGSVYAYGRSLYVTLLEYHVRSERTGTINKANRRQPDQSGLMNRTVLFTPESAKRPDSYRGTHATNATLVIDYEGLAALSTMPATQSLRPAPAVGSAQTSTSLQAPDTGTNAQLRHLQEQMSQKNRELEDMRKELQDIRRQMREPAAVSPPPAR
ncbi:MAG: hypothetical protein ABL970_05175 [Nitrospira sp.]